MAKIHMREKLPPGASEKIYFDSEAKELLAALTVDARIHKSNVICALIRAASGKPSRPGEELVYAQIKRAFGDDQFLEFKRAVAELIPKIAHRHPNKSNPDFWTIGKAGIMPFFNPGEENAGCIFADASKLMEEHELERVLVVTPTVEAISSFLRKSLLKADIIVVPIAGLKDLLKWPFPRGKNKKRRLAK